MEDLFRINARRQAVAENIEKAMTVGFTPDEELEKALADQLSEKTAKKMGWLKEVS